jgi:CheY-like chemotaxis protein
MLMEDVPPDSPLQGSLTEIYTGALRARDLVQQILAFSRRGKNEPKLMRIQPVIEEALKMLRSTIPTSIEIRARLDQDCGFVKADPIQIHQIVMNLATNAYHAMETHGGQLEVRLKKINMGAYDRVTPDMTPGWYACLSVADTGTGMEKTVTEKIIDPFFTTKETGKGTGMGLSVVHGIVKRLNGGVQVFSRPGKGTRIHVYFPLENTGPAPDEDDSDEPVQGGTEHVLLVDDEDSIIMMERQMLERLGYRVTPCAGSSQALDVFRAGPDQFDLLITDMAMPGMTGESLVRELCRIRPELPVLLCTGYSDAISEEKAAFMGIKGFLFKPVEKKDLAQKIREVLDKPNLS